MDGVVLEGLGRLELENASLKRVLREEVVPQLAEIDADPSRLTPIGEAFARLEAGWRARAAKAK